MYTFLTELNKRPDGIINSSVTPRSSLATGHIYAVYGCGTDAHGRRREHHREQAL